MSEKEKLINPLTQYYHGGYEWQPQEAPGVQAKMHPLPDCGEKVIAAAENWQGAKHW